MMVVGISKSALWGALPDVVFLLGSLICLVVTAFSAYVPSARGGRFERRLGIGAGGLTLTVMGLYLATLFFWGPEGASAHSVLGRSCLVAKIFLLLSIMPTLYSSSEKRAGVNPLLPGVSDGLFSRGFLMVGAGATLMLVGTAHPLFSLLLIFLQLVCLAFYLLCKWPRKECSLILRHGFRVTVIFFVVYLLGCLVLLYQGRPYFLSSSPAPAGYLGMIIVCLSFMFLILGPFYRRPDRNSEPLFCYRDFLYGGVFIQSAFVFYLQKLLVSFPLPLDKSFFIIPVLGLVLTAFRAFRLQSLAQILMNQGFLQACTFLLLAGAGSAKLSLAYFVFGLLSQTCFTALFLEVRCNGRPVISLMQMKGLGHVHPLASVLLSVACLCQVGAPLLGVFFLKFEILGFLLAFPWSQWGLALVWVFLSAFTLSGAPFFKIMSFLWFKNPEAPGIHSSLSLFGLAFLLWVMLVSYGIWYGLFEKFL